ncbi:hypothetical protein [Aurantivibrio plasticivorans]
MATDTHQSSSNNRVTPGSDAQPLEATSVTLNAAPQDTSSTERSSNTWHQYQWPIIGAAICIPLVILVVFVLPNLVTSSPTASAIKSEEKTEAPAAPKNELESPWQDAQLAKARRETQDLLAILLDKQAQLDSMNVADWANNEYQTAVDFAHQGDEHYRARNFTRAQEAYRSALSTFDDILLLSETMFSNALSDGAEAIQSGTSSIALAAFERALAITPSSELAREGLNQAKVLDEVVTLLKAGSRAERQEKFNDAQNLYQKALTLLPEHQATQARLVAVNDRIRDNQFAAKMATGFAALAADNVQIAISSFQQALTIKPNAADANTALRQAQQQQTNKTIQSTLKQALQQESEEKWQEALSSYKAILELDRNIVEAQVGKIRSQVRHDVDKKLTDILKNSARLNSPAVHAQYTAFYKDTLSIATPNSKLETQLNRLNMALHAANQPTIITLQSDNETQVTLYRVGDLGVFSETTVTLKPGTYTAVGTRRGYRDARTEFTVSGENQNQTIVIQCSEKINNG